MDSRRSMGQAKPWAQPKRTSGIGQSGADAAAAGGSKIPKIKVPPRSSSSDAHRRATNAGTWSTAKSPMSRASRTPLQSRHLMPLSSANSGSSVRSYGAFGGRESMTPNHRESVKIAFKDTRPISDKAWQQEKVREIIDFCRDTEYPGILAPNNFPLNSTEFRKLFEFIMRFTIPDFAMPRTQDMSTELPALLKKIGYPGTVSKSTFQTLGTQHSWGSTLGILSYLLLRTRIFLNKNNLDSPDSILFQNPMEDQVPGSDRLLFDFLVNCFSAFNNGQDEFGEEVEILEERFMEVYQVDDNLANDLDRKLVCYKNEYEEVRSTSIDVEQIQKVCKAKRDDWVAMKDFCDKSAEHLGKRQEECATMARTLAELERTKNALKSSVSELDKLCREEKGVNPEEASSMEFMVNELEQQLMLKKKALEEARSVLWKTEQSLGKTNTTIDSICQQFNLFLMELKIENAKALRLDRHKSIEEVRSKLLHLMEDLRMQEKLLKESCGRHDTDHHHLKQQLNQKLSSMKKLEDELKKRQDEIDSFQRKIDIENKELTAAVEEAKEKVAHHSEREKRNLKALQDEMDRTQNDLKAILEQKEARVKEGLTLVHEANAFASEERERRLKERSEAIKLYKQKVARTVEALMTNKREVQAFTDSLPKLN